MWWWAGFWSSAGFLSSSNYVERLFELRCRCLVHGHIVLGQELLHARHELVFAELFERSPALPDISDMHPVSCHGRDMDHQTVRRIVVRPISAVTASRSSRVTGRSIVITSVIVGLLGVSASSVASLARYVRNGKIDDAVLIRPAMC